MIVDGCQWLMSVPVTVCSHSSYVRGDVLTCALIVVISSLSCFRGKVPPAAEEGGRVYVTEGWDGISTVEFY